LSALAASIQCRSVLKYQQSSQGELLDGGGLNSQTTPVMSATADSSDGELSEAKHLWSNPLWDSRIDPRFFDFAQNDTEIWLLVQFWTTVVQRTSEFECTLSRRLK
jgi:hypothetical protein